jgi:hypothetical protein
VTLQICSLLVVLALQCLNLWRSLVNGRGIKGTRHDLTGLSSVTTDIQKQMHIVRQNALKTDQALAKIDALMSTTKPYSGGRRETDRREVPEEPPPPKPYGGVARREGDQRRPPPQDAGPPRGGRIWPIGETG